MAGIFIETPLNWVNKQNLVRANPDQPFGINSNSDWFYVNSAWAESPILLDGQPNMMKPLEMLSQWSSCHHLVMGNMERGRVEPLGSHILDIHLSAGFQTEFSWEEYLVVILLLLICGDSTTRTTKPFVGPGLRSSIILLTCISIRRHVNINYSWTGPGTGYSLTSIIKCSSVVAVHLKLYKVSTK